MRIVFMGTPIFATAVLSQLIQDGCDVIGVVSQPDKKVGRKQVISVTPVKQCALENNIPVFQPNKIKEDFEQIKIWNPDLIVTCAYGQMIPQHILDFPKLGSINVHASLLPDLRGGAPIHKAIMYGRNKTGVSIMRMVQKMDAGDFMLQKEVCIEKDDTTSLLHDKLMNCAQIAIHEALPLLESGQAIFKKQNEENVTYAYNISKEEEYIHCDRDVQQVYNHIRSLIAWPVGYIVIGDKKIKIHCARIANHQNLRPVNTLFVEKHSLLLQCIDGCIELFEVQLEGKAKSSAKDFINGAGRKFLND